MSQQLFAGSTCTTTKLDANFTELYSLYNQFAAGRISVLSGASGSFGRVSVGRTAVEIDLGVCGGSSEFYVGTVAGDSVLRATSGALWVGISSQGLKFSSGVIAPNTDNTVALGGSSNRFSVVYAGTGAINTSDAREKTAVAPLTAAELAASVALAREVGTFRFLAAVAEKGGDARMHVGMTVQRAIEVMQAHGLDPMAYGFICHDEWPDDRYGFRPDELLLFLARGFDARLAALESAAH